MSDQPINVGPAVDSDRWMSDPTVPKCFIWPGEVAIVANSIRDAFDLLTLSGLKVEHLYQYRTCPVPTVIDLRRRDRH